MTTIFGARSVCSMKFGAPWSRFAKTPYTARSYPQTPWTFPQASTARSFQLAARIRSFRRHGYGSPPPPPPGGRRLLLASLGASTLTPAALASLSEEHNKESADDGKTGEQAMLEASRREIDAALPDWVADLDHGWQRKTYTFVDTYIVEPIATGFRFLHLVFIFVPVLLTVPVIWFGGRVKDRDNERSGTLWWYGFLVKSMERAGAAFIKVCLGSTVRTCQWLSDNKTAWPMGRISN